MSLIKSISGIRGTIGGLPGENLTPLDVVKFTAAYGVWLKIQGYKAGHKVVIGRDARLSGGMVNQLVVATLQGLGIDVIDLGLSTTPTVEMMVPHFDANGGIVITASHNPKQWNALKLLNHKGEFISASDGLALMEIVQSGDIGFAEVDHLGSYEVFEGAIDIHIDKILELPLVNVRAIKKAGFKVVVDAVNSTGGIAVPALLKKLNVKYTAMYCEPTGHFPHNPEPLKEHLGDISRKVVETRADFGIVVDPDVDRLAFVSDDGEMFGEEYTLVAVADYVLSRTPSATVSNLSSSRALKDIAEKYGQEYYPAAVGEVNVVEKMKETNALIGGEGNGGIIYPELHYGRDALVGIALFLSHLAEQKLSVKVLRESYPAYYMAKKKIELTPGLNVDKILDRLKKKFSEEKINTVDGVKIDFDKGWVHLRKSNTEPIIRIYTESTSVEEANLLADRIIENIKELI